MNGSEMIMNWMKWGVISVKPGTPLKQAAAIVVEKRIGTLPVIDRAGVLIGVATLRDIIQVFLPDFVALMSNIDFVKDYGNLGEPSEAALQLAENMTVADVMHEPVAVEDDSSLIRALAVMEKHDLQDLCVVRDGVLVGIASRVDIGRAFLSDWAPPGRAGDRQGQ